MGGSELHLPFYSSGLKAFRFWMNRVHTWAWTSHFQLSCNKQLPMDFVNLFRLLILFGKTWDTYMCSLDIKTFFGSAPYNVNCFYNCALYNCKIWLLPLQLGVIPFFWVINFYISHNCFAVGCWDWEVFSLVGLLLSTSRRSTFRVRAK